MTSTHWSTGLLQSRFACIDEASRDTLEYYRWRALLSDRLIGERCFTWLRVEGDWPDCWRINRWVRGSDDETLMFTACSPASNGGRPAGGSIRRWPSSLWDSLHEIISWLEANAPNAVPDAMRGRAVLRALPGGSARVRPEHPLVPES